MDRSNLYFFNLNCNKCSNMLPMIEIHYKSFENDFLSFQLCFDGYSNPRRVILTSGRVKHVFFSIKIPISAHVCWRWLRYMINDSKLMPYVKVGNPMLWSDCRVYPWQSKHKTGARGPTALSRVRVPTKTRLMRRCLPLASQHHINFTVFWRL